MRTKKIFWYSLLGALVLRMVLIPITHHGDVENHVIWGIYAREFGLSGYYDFLNFFNYARPNQPPLTILLYLGVRYVYEWLFAVLWWINVQIGIFPSMIVSWFEKYGFIAVLKLPAALADLGLGVLIFNLVKKINKEKALLAMNLFLFNPLVWYNSSLWGQTDSVLVLLGLGSIFAFLYQRIFLGAILFAATLMFKATLVIFAPVVLILFLKQKPAPRKIVASVLLFLATIYLLAKSFSVGPTFNWIFDLYTKKIAVGELHYLTANAFNLWAIFFGLDPVKDSWPILGIPAFWVGLGVFVLLSISPIWRLFKKSDLATTLTVLVLLAMSAFLFLTRMHERYLYPIFPILTILAVQKNKLFLALMTLSTIHLINLYHFWWYPRIELLVNLFSAADRLVPRVLSGITILIFLWFYLYFVKGWQKTKQ